MKMLLPCLVRIHHLHGYGAFAEMRTGIDHVTSYRVIANFSNNQTNIFSWIKGIENKRHQFVLMQK